MTFTKHQHVAITRHEILSEALEIHGNLVLANDVLFIIKMIS